MVHANNIEHDESSRRHKIIRLQGREVYIYNEVSSTNTIAKELAARGAAEGTVVLGRFQTLGKGRFQRQWICPPGKGLLLSIILRPDLEWQYIPQLTLLGGVVIAESIKQLTGCQVGIKWPNDVLMHGKKVCGILAQNSFYGGHSEYVVLGLGININLRVDHLPEDCKETTTSLLLETGSLVSRFEFLQHLLTTWDDHYNKFLQLGHSYLRAEWLANNITLGKEVTIKKSNDTFLRGTAVDITPMGGLLVRFPDGSKEEFLAEDVSLGKDDNNACV